MNYPCHEPCRDNDGCACRAAEAARPVVAYTTDRDYGDEVGDPLIAAFIRALFAREDAAIMTDEGEGR